MNQHEQRVAAAFNHAASTYHQHCDVQTFAGEHLIRQLLNVRNSFLHVADAGCGTGQTTAALANSISCQSCTGFDIADELLKKARQNTNDITYIHGDFNQLVDYPTQFDLIFSNLALHWSHDFLHTLQVMYAALTDTGLLAFSLPLSGTFAEIEHHLSVQPFFSEHAITSILNNSGFKLLGVNKMNCQKIFPDTISALRYLKLTGTNYVRERKHHTLRAKSFLSQLHIHQLTYQLGFFMASK